MTCLSDSAPPPPPPQVHFLKYLKNALSCALQTFWKLKWTNVQNKNTFFNSLRPLSVTIATSKVDACFWNHISAVFMQKLTRTRRLFAAFMKSVPNVVCCGNGACAHYVMVSKFQWKPFWLATQRDPQNDWTATQNRVNYDVFAQVPFGLDTPLDGVLVTIFLSHSFSRFNDLKLLSPWYQEWCHSIWFFISFQKKFLLLTFNKGNKVFDLWITIPSQKYENYEPP